jgi:hypothetical protein
LPIPPFTPAAPTNLRDAFDHDDYIFELKMDGFQRSPRAREHVRIERKRLLSSILPEQP